MSKRLKIRAIPNTHHANDTDHRTLLLEDDGTEGGKHIGMVEPEYADAIVEAVNLPASAQFADRMYRMLIQIERDFEPDYEMFFELMREIAADWEKGE